MSPSNGARKIICYYLNVFLQLTFLVGCFLVIGSSVWYFMVNIESKKSVYLAAVLSGCGCSIMLVTSLAMTADLIGSHKVSELACQ